MGAGLVIKGCALQARSKPRQDGHKLRRGLEHDDEAGSMNMKLACELLTSLIALYAILSRYKLVLLN